MSEPREFCFRCQKVTPSRVEKHVTHTRYLCAVCGWQVDADYDDDAWPDEDDGEPTGCCAECECNLYGDEGPLCGQCEWSLSFGAGRNSE